MKLDQIYIRKYGPLQKDLQLDDHINIIRGPNESGKSLLVEAFLRQLSSGYVPNPVVDEAVEGFVEISNGSSSRTLQQGDSLSSYWEECYNQSIHGQELRNVFVIRSGDLTFDERDDFYSHITDKLTGRRVEDIDEIRDTLTEKGRLTPGRLDISDSQEYHDAKTQLSEATELKADIDQYISEAEQNDIALAERNRIDAKRREETLETKIQHLEAAREKAQKTQRCENLREDIEDIENNVEQLGSLPDSEVLDDIDRRVQQLNEDKAHQSMLTEEKQSSISLAKYSIGAGLAAFALAVGTGFTAGSFLAPLVFMASAGYFWYQGASIRDELTELEVRENEINSDARAAGIPFEQSEDIHAEIERIRSTRAELTEQNQGKKAVLERELDFEADSMDETVDMAQTRLASLEDDIDESVDLEYDDRAYQSARSRLDEAKATRKENEQKLQAHRETLEAFHERAYELDFSIFTGERLQLDITNLDALRSLEKRLSEFITAIEGDAEASRVAIEIFEEIQEEETRQTAALFEESTRVSEIFREITSGRYDTVTYDTEQNQLEVEKSTGERFTPDELSDGTKDQLYLSIRVGLGEKLLRGQPGFFLLDDAFLTSDPERLQIQADLVEQLADEGWQILYLSSKEDAISALQARTENDVIDLQPLE